MKHSEALDVLRRFNAWRRYGGFYGDAPDCPAPAEVGEAIDVAISVLDGMCNKPKKEFYGG